MIFKDYYKILGLETNKVSPEEIKVAFREQAKRYHPDVNQGKETEERFKDINEAYKVLGAIVSKRKYDRMWNNYVGKKIVKQEYEESPREQGTVFSNFFNMFFGIQEVENKEESKIKRKLAVKGDNIDTEINVGIEEAFFGLEKNISLRTVTRKNEDIFCKNTIRNKKW